MKAKLKKVLSFASAAVMAASQCAASGLFTTTAADTKFPFVIEGEDLKGAELWTAIYQNEIPGYSGEGFTYLTGGELSFTVTVPEDGMYSIVVKGAQILDEGGRQQTVAVNGVEYSKVVPYADKWTDFNFGMVRLKAGENEISFINKYGYMAIDYVTVTEAEFPDLSIADDTLVDPAATPEAQSLMKYLKSVYGSHILSGQQEIYGGGHGVQTSIRYDASSDKCTDNAGKEYTIDKDSYDTDEQGNKFPWHCMDETGFVYTYDTQNRSYAYNDYDYECRYLYELTGHYPAIRGFDFNTHNPGFAWEDGVTDRMIDWAVNKNGICTASWHITVPTSMADFEIDDDGNITKISDDWQKFTYSNKTDFVTANVLVEGTKEYVFFQEAMRLLAAEISKLQDAGVPLIFRPLHEAEGNPGVNGDGSGAWFWWSKEGYKVYNEVWKLLYTTLTETYGLHNIIWEQNLYAWSDDSALWYTGDEWVDIVGFDKYNTEYNRHDGKQKGEPNEDAEGGIFYTLYDYVNGKKMVAMPENDSIPSLTNMLVEHADWLYFCTWYDGESGAPQFISGAEYQDPEMLTELFQSEFCLTLDELPADLYSGSGVTPPTTTKPTTPPDDDIAYGDANCDGEVGMADAVLIMQSQANPNRYGLGGSEAGAITEQGSLNGDCYDPGSGLTGRDALAIQKYLLKIIPDLPEEA